MQRDSRPDGLDTSQHSRQGSGILDSHLQLQRKDSRSSISASSFIPPPQLVPEPAYIALSAASQIVNSEYVSRGPDWPEDEGENDNEVVLSVSRASLVMVNSFLDQLLFSFLKGARSTSIIALKPAITDVLKPRLAKDAIQGADEELQGYLTGGDDEELSDFHNGQELKGERSLQRIFRRTRLRCMVYTRLGDMEEEDEDMYLLESETGQDPEERHSLANDLGNVSPAAAIFLTSIMEFIGEQALMIAGEATFARISSKKPSTGELHPVVEEGDVEKMAFNTTLGRLWRSWRNRTRPSSMISPRPTSRDFHGRKTSMSKSAMTSRATSFSEVGENGCFDGNTPRQGHSMAQILQKDVDPAEIPLPEARGFPEEPDFGTDSEGAEAPSASDGRRRSMIEYQSVRDTVVDRSHQPVGDPHAEERPARPQHQRSFSMPIRPTPYQSPPSEIYATPSEGPDPSSATGDEKRTDVPKLTDDSQTVRRLSPRNPAVSTMYDGVLGAESIDPQLRSREVSMVSDYSTTGATDGSYAHEQDVSEALTPQALNFKKPQSLVQTEEGGPESRTSTVSEVYSFAGDGHDAPTGIFGPPSRRKEIPQEAGMSSSRGDSREPNENGNDQTGSSKNFASLATVQGEDRLRTYDESGKAVKRDIPVLYEAPSNQDVIYNSKAPTKNLQDDLPPAPPIKPHFQGVPPLTPLRELRDAAHDTSDEASSVSAGYDYDGSRSDDLGPTQSYRKSEGQRGPSYTSSPAVQSQTSVPASKAVDLRSQPQAGNTGAERAAVQRVTSSSAATRDATSSQSYGRTSTGSANGRPQTSGSASSKLHKIVTRESGDSNRQPVPRRSSSGRGDIQWSGGRASSSAKAVSKELDFENLIKSDETIQYTLTPQNMREMESPNSPRWSQRPEIGEPASLIRTASSEQQTSTSSRSPKTMKGLNGLRSNPTATNGGQSTMDFASGQRTSPTSPQPGSIPKSPNGRPNAVPRDPAMKDSSMRDFADFIRSTGPDSDPKTMMKGAPANVNKHTRDTSSSSQQAGKPSSKKITKQAPVVVPKRPENIAPARSTSKLKARDPVVLPGNETADLADFFRSGPPGIGSQMDSPRQTQRAPPHQQSPVLSNGMAKGRMVSAASIASTQDSFAPSKMTQSSSNSRTGLLDNAKRAAPVKNNQSQRPSPPDDSGGPVRKQRRIRDPYAIDSDEEEDYGVVPEPARQPQQHQQEEESLSDFLRNYTPPPETTATRNTPLDITQPPPSLTTASKDRKAGGASLRDRIKGTIPDTRQQAPKAPKKTSSSKPSPQQPTKTDKQQGISSSSQRQASNSTSPQPARGRPLASSTTNTPAPQLPPINARADSPHLISQNGSNPDTFRPSQPAYNGGGGTKSTIGRAKPQARDEVAGGKGGGLGDLAEFLRDTEPPAPVRMGNSAGAVSISPEPSGRNAAIGGGGGGLGRMFGRRRKG